MEWKACGVGMSTQGILSILTFVTLLRKGWSGTAETTTTPPPPTATTPTPSAATTATATAATATATTTTTTAAAATEATGDECCATYDGSSPGEICQSASP